MQVTSQRFKDLVLNPVVPLDWGVQVSFTKEENPDIEYFILDESLLDGGDILAPSGDDPIQPWFTYEFARYGGRMMSMEWTREIDFPYSVQSAMADFTLSNTDEYFTPGGSSEIEEFVLPKRPVMLFQGFQTAENLAQFIGLTQGMPEVTREAASFHALDFLSELYEQPLTEVVAMRDVYTHEVLEVILIQLGLTPSQFNLARSRNKIPFLFFDKGVNAGQVLRQLMQAEGGLLWMDEMGIFRFSPRVTLNQDPVYVLDERSVIDMSVSSDAQIINHVRILSSVREVQAFQSVYYKTSAGEGTDESWVVPPTSSIVKFLDLTDPIYQSQKPELGFASGASWFTARDVNGNPVNSGITTEVETFTNSYKITFTNSNVFAVEIDELDLWAEPALEIDEEGMRYELQVDSSVEKYGRMTLEIDNDFIGTPENANSLALMILDGQSEYSGVLNANVRPNPALQLNDVVDVDYREYQGLYKITKITNVLRTGVEYYQELRLKKYTAHEWFILSGDEPRSLLDGTDVLAY